MVAETGSVSRAPRVLTVVLADTYRTQMAFVHENEWLPYERRTVQINLTEEQRRALAPRVVGLRGDEEVYEDIHSCWLEPVGDA